MSTITSPQKRATALRRLGLAAVVLVPLAFAGLFVGALGQSDTALDRIPAAIVNEDKLITTTDADGEEQNVFAGRQLVTELTGADGFDWTITNAEDAQALLDSGAVYAVLTVPSDFSESILSLSGDDPEKADISIATDDAHSYLTGSVAQVVGQTMTDTFGREITKQYLAGLYDGMGQLGSALGEAADGADQLADGASKLSGGLTQYTDGVGDLADGASELSTGVDQYTDGVEGLAGGASQLANGVGQYTGGVDALSSGLASLNAGASGLTALNDGITTYTGGVSSFSGGVSSLNAGAQGLTDLSGTITQYTGGVTEVTGGMNALAAEIEAALPPERAAEFTTQLAALQSLSDSGPALSDNAGNLVDLQSAIADLDTGAQGLSAGGQALAGNASAAISGIQSGISASASGANALSSKSSEVASGAAGVAGGANGLAAGSPRIASGVSELADGAGQLATRGNEVVSGASELASGAGDLATGLQEGADQVPVTDAATQARTVDAVVEPVGVEVTTANAVTDVGQGVATFFVPLGLWIGALAVFLVLRPVSRRALTSTARNGRLVAASIARAGAVTAAQAVLLVALLHGSLGVSWSLLPATFAFALVTALAFTAFHYLLTIGLGRGGLVVSLFLLAVQVTSTGGIYPIELLSTPFQIVSPFLPLTWAVNGMQGIIAGGAVGSVVSSALILVAFGVGSVILAMVAIRRTRRADLLGLVPATA